MKTLLLAFLVIGSAQVASASTQAGLALCPQGTDGFESTLLSVDEAKVNTAAYGSEPNFSSKIQWDASGIVTLVRKNKPSIVLGQGVRPLSSSHCGVFPFTVSDDIKIEARSKKGLPFPVCGFSGGCQVVHPKKDTITIRTDHETITFVGNWG